MRRATLLTLLLFVILISCSSPAKVNLGGTIVGNIPSDSVIEQQSSEGFLIITFNPLSNTDIFMRNVQVQDGSGWIDVSDKIVKNSDKQVVLGQAKLPRKEYSYIKFTIDSATFNEESLTTPIPHVVLPFKFNLTKDFTILSLDLLLKESLNDDLTFYPVFRIELQNALDISVKSDNSINVYDREIIKTEKYSIKEKGDFSTKQKINTSALLEENPKGLQINYENYIANKQKNDDLPSMSLSIYENKLNPTKIVLKKNQTITLSFENKVGKILGISLPDFGYDFLSNPEEVFNLELNPQKTGSFNIKCIYPCWRKEGQNLGIIVVEEERKIRRYN